MEYGLVDGKEYGEYNGASFVEIYKIFVMADSFSVTEFTNKYSFLFLIILVRFLSVLFQI